MEYFKVGGAKPPMFSYHSVKLKTIDMFIAVGRLCNICVPICISITGFIDWLWGEI